MEKQRLINKLNACTTQEEVGQVIRKHPIIFAEDYKLNDVAYNVRYRIEKERYENSKNNTDMRTELTFPDQELTEHVERTGQAPAGYYEQWQEHGRIRMNYTGEDPSESFLNNSYYQEQFELTDNMEVWNPF